MRTHQELDARSLALHSVVVGKMRREPALLERAQQTLARWRLSASDRSQPYLDEWQRLLDGALEVCLSAAVEEPEKADALRQSSPLACLLSPQERFAFLCQWRQAHAATRT